MTDRDRTNDKLRSRKEGEPDDKRDSQRGKDVMRGRDFAGVNIFNTEREQTRDRERVAEHGGESLDPDDEFVTDAEIEAREERRAERNED